ncbi:unnamed protein product [Tilletia laevis]|uniref:Mid2 domain-containing protein n=1 Tax=Tilletia laevis TaxID=157183 RepID=A0A9N8LK71_9BASI|nr:hypothetical protein CF336_g5201 [Tilletia laevis]KAE8197953.1 hypothetical protein CF335_g4493 [Tilletia laevis]CAD6912678.1 unnamed protein product [Tilletia laevis]CAD6953402.1 unnamed protein product [Tilletia laevis]
MSYPRATPAPRTGDIAVGLQNRDLLVDVVDGVTSIFDGLLTGLGLTESTRFTVIGSSTIVPTDSTSTSSTTSQTTSSRPDDASTSTTSSSSPTSSPPATETTSTSDDSPSSTSQDASPTSTSTIATETSTTEESTSTPTPTSTRTSTRDEPTSTRSRSTETITAFTTTSSLSLSFSGTQTFTQVVVVTIPAGVPATPFPDHSSSSSNSGKIGGVVGGVVGGLALLAFILAALFTFKRRKDRTGKGWFLCFGTRPGSRRRGSKGTGSDPDTTWPTFDPTANTGSAAAAGAGFGATHRDPFRNEPTLPNVGDDFDDDIENPNMTEYNRNSYGGPSPAAAAGGGAYYARSPTQQSFYPQSSLHSNGNMAPAGNTAPGMYPDDAAAQAAYAYNAARAASPGPSGGAGALSAQSHGAESFGNDYSHLDPPDVRAQRGAEAAAAGGAAHVVHARMSSQASAGNPYGFSPFMSTNTQLFGATGDASNRSATPPVPSTSATPPPPSYNATAAGSAARAPTPPATRLPVVMDDDGLDVAAAERAVPGSAGANRLQLLNPDDGSTIAHHGQI